MSEQHTESRRDFLKQAATVAWATPLILTMLPSSAHAQVSCAPPGSPCGTWSTALATCIPNPELGLCCESCDQRGASPNEQFCFCS